MTVKNKNWKRGVLFACITLANQMPFADEPNMSEISDIINQAEIPVKEIEPILVDYEEKEIIDYLKKAAKN